VQSSGAAASTDVAAHAGREEGGQPELSGVDRVHKREVRDHVRRQNVGSGGRWGRARDEAAVEDVNDVLAGRALLPEERAQTGRGIGGGKPPDQRLRPFARAG
jgi:hypothetical protein